MKNRKLLTVIAIIAAASLIAVFFMFVLPATIKRVVEKDTITQGKAVFGENVRIIVTKEKDVTEYQPIRDSLMIDCRYYDAIMNYQRDLKLPMMGTDEQRCLLGGIFELLVVSDEHIQTDEERNAYMEARMQAGVVWWSPRDKDNPKVVQSNLTTLLNDAGKHRPLNCLIAETQTFITKARRGEYSKVLYEQYTIDIELPLTPKVSYFGSTTIQVDIHQPLNTHKDFIKLLCQAIKYKRENNCP